MNWSKMKCQKLLTLSLITLGLILMSQTSDACSCMEAHPQTHYCNADFVIIARVLRKADRKQNTVYKIDTRKTYKMTEKAQHYLKHGRLLSGSPQNSCFVQLTVGKLYVIAGRSANINICNTYIKEYHRLSIAERRSLAGGYKKGCACQIKPCYDLDCEEEHQEGVCLWSPWSKCEHDFGNCIPSRNLGVDGKPSKCHWRRTPPYVACIRDP